MYREYLLTVYESGFDRISTFMFSVNIRAGPWYVRALRHESNCGPLIHVFANCSIDLILVLFLLGHRLGDDLVDWNSGVSVCPSVRPYVRPYVHKKFFRFPSNLVCG